MKLPSAAPAQDSLEFYPTTESLRRIKVFESSVIVLALGAMWVAVGLTQDLGMIGLGVLGTIAIGLVLLSQVRVFVRCSDPDWLRGNTARVTLGASGLIVRRREDDVQESAWSDLDDARFARHGIIASRRHGGRNILIPGDDFTYGERKAMLAELRRRIAAAAPND